MLFVFDVVCLGFFYSMLLMDMRIKGRGSTTCDLNTAAPHLNCSHVPYRVSRVDERPPDAPHDVLIDVEGMIIAYLLDALADDHVGVHVANTMAGG